MSEKTTYHTPALLNETVVGLAIRPSGTYVDLTFGGGGHSREILRHLNEDGRLLAFDQDEDAVANIPDDSRLIFVLSNFKYLSNFLKYHNIESVDGIVADLGVSFHHFDDVQRGFSFRADSLLDMRMNQKAKRSAKDIVNDYSAEQLADVFYLYGELRNSRAIASAIVNGRKKSPILTTQNFVELLRPFLSREKEKKVLAQAFQALRIEVNQEMNVLAEMLQQTVDCLSSQGRLAVLTYHSLEDRLVKNFIRTGNVKGRVDKDFYGNVIAPFRAVNNRVVVPNADEIACNPRSRSAKLRIAEKR